MYFSIWKLCLSLTNHCFAPVIIILVVGLEFDKHQNTQNQVPSSESVPEVPISDSQYEEKEKIDNFIALLPERTSSKDGMLYVLIRLLLIYIFSKYQLRVDPTLRMM